MDRSMAVGWLWIFLGGGTGAVLRAVLSGLVQARMDGAFPWGILAVNLVGCFGIGVFVTLGEVRGLLGESGRLFAITGLMGGFTTFSAFGLDGWRLLGAGHPELAAANAVVSVVGGVLAVGLGVGLARGLA